MPPSVPEVPAPAELPAALHRRTFLKGAAGIAAATLVIRYLPGPAAAAETGGAEGDLPPGSGWQGPPGQARWRIDGFAKVTGRKVYASDYRAADLGWPAERYALVVRATQVNVTITDVKVDALPADARPMLVIDGATVAAGQITDPENQTPLIVPAGAAADYYGQPVAILIFADRATYRRATTALSQGNLPLVVYGAPVSPPASEVYGPATYMVRVAGQGKDVFSQVLDGVTDSLTYPPDACPAQPVDPHSAVTCEAYAYAQQIQQEMSGGQWDVYQQEYGTQIIDPLFMERETGIGWYEAGTKTLHLLVGTQSPNDAVSSTAEMFGSTQRPVETVELNACYPGGGFGGRDSSAFTPILAMAAYFADAPVYLTYDRFEQFQAGHKRHGGTLAQTIAVDKDGTFQALNAKYEFNGGGQANMSPWVAQLAGLSAGGAYAFPRSVVSACSDRTPSVTSGSMRGFGGPQALFALESLIDEIAATRGIDPIDLRRRNLLKQTDRTVSGAPLLQPVRLTEILDRAQAHPLWQTRAAVKAVSQDGPLAYGVGFALSFFGYGTGTDGVVAGVELAADGTLKVVSNAIDMGNGSATTLACATADWLGNNADNVTMGATGYWDPLELTSGGYGTLSRAHANTDGQTTPAVFMSSSACITAFQQVHALNQACQVLFQSSLFPAAQALWQAPQLNPANVGWQGGKLTAPGLAPLTLAQLAAQAASANRVMGAMVHALFQTAWVSAEYAVDGPPQRWEIDALAVARANGDWKVVPRRRITAPAPGADRWGRSVYTASGCLAAVEIDRSSGQVTVSEIVGFLDPGRVLQPDIVAGQFEGGVAQGIGYALYEGLPPGADGPGNGQWNLAFSFPPSGPQYYVPRLGDMPVGKLTLDILPPVGDRPPGKGIAEAVMTPVTAAIANAVADATGKRVRQLPITPDKLQSLS
ncbi:MAG TPA: molybdopterin cofactor-binding domain-containing protein [Azospirillaceae bacterium]|nr:molybdopterin cofactor-binding domain-containing protein [Azospirillaceae bacterium]